MYIRNIIIAICSLLFLPVGADKFFAFLEPPCSMEQYISPVIWKMIGAVQIGAGILIWFRKPRKYVVGFFFIFMLVFTIVHLAQRTYDVGGAAFMAVLLGILVWNPDFIRPKSKF